MQERTKRDMIPDTMQELMNESSDNAASVSDIARKAGIGKGSICYYSSSENDIMEAVIEYSYSMAIERSKELATTASISASKKMETIFRACIEASSKLKRQEECNSSMELQQSVPTYRKFTSLLIKNLKPIPPDIILQGVEEGSLICEYPQEIAGIIPIILTVKLDNHLSPVSAEEIQNLLRAFPWMQAKSIEIVPENPGFLRIQTDIHQPEREGGNPPMKNWLLKTAWPMVPPVPYSTFHVAFAITGILCAVFLAQSLRGSNWRSYYRILFLCGLVLALSELYKQLFICYIVSQGRCDWWYLLFQFCSLPVYLCLLIPLLRGNASDRILTTFVQDSDLLDGVMAPLEPPGLLHPYRTLTLYGPSWHIMPVSISPSTTFTRGTDTGVAADGHASVTPAPNCYIFAPSETATAATSSVHSLTAYPQMFPLFAIFRLIAIAISTMIYGAVDMLYISPYYPMTQVMSDEISVLCGTGAGIFIYLLSICLGDFPYYMELGYLQFLAQKHKES